MDVSPIARACAVERPMRHQWHHFRWGVAARWYQMASGKTGLAVQNSLEGGGWSMGVGFHPKWSVIYHGEPWQYIYNHPSCSNPGQTTIYCRNLAKTQSRLLRVEPSILNFSLMADASLLFRLPRLQSDPLTISLLISQLFHVGNAVETSKAARIDSLPSWKCKSGFDVSVKYKACILSWNILLANRCTTVFTLDKVTLLKWHYLLPLSKLFFFVTLHPQFAESDWILWGSISLLHAGSFFSLCRLQSQLVSGRKRATSWSVSDFPVTFHAGFYVREHLFLD